MQALLRALAPIVAAEQELGGKAISEGWANVDGKKLEDWSKIGQESVPSELKQLWDDTYGEEYARLIRRVSTRCLWLYHKASLTIPSAFGATEESQVRRS